MARCITISLLLFLMLSHVLARPEPVFRDVTPVETHHGEKEIVHKVDVDEDGCKELGEDECMMRKTVEAHLDYIYTQKNNKP